MTTFQGSSRFYRGLNNQDFNKKVQNYLSLFVDDKDLLETAKIINPFGITKKSSHFNEKVIMYLDIYNDFQLNEKSLLGVLDDKIVIFAKLLYLANIKCLFDFRKSFEKDHFTHVVTKEKIAYALKVLETLNHSKLHRDLEDKFFKFLAPTLFKKYNSLRQQTYQNYEESSKKIVSEIEGLLGSVDYEHEVQIRLKTIYSIYKKIVKKNIMYSLVLDVIGVRIIVKDEIDCYKAMLSITQNYQVLNNKIKDYIAVPKDNGYQSIHLTVIFNDLPVEIQIRTEDMNVHAVYGIASHVLYKTESYSLINKI